MVMPVPATSSRRSPQLQPTRAARPAATNAATAAIGTSDSQISASWASAHASGSRCSPAMMSSTPAAAANQLCRCPGRRRTSHAPATVAAATRPVPPSTAPDRVVIGAPAYRAVPRPSTGGAVGVARGVPALQPGLVDSQPAEVVPMGEEPLVYCQSATGGIRVQLRHPGAYPLGVEDLVPCRVQGIGHVDALAVAADLHHLGPAAERLTGYGGVRLAPHDAAQLYRGRLPRVERIGHVVLLEFSGTKAGHV